MIKKKSFTAAFTLIELLVVITIIGILAGIALPVFNSVQTKGAQTKALAQAKQVGLSLKLFASDNEGVYPRKDTPVALAAEPTDANTAFAVLFPQYLQNETIFGNKLVYFVAPHAPDNNITAGNVLVKGENVYGYMTQLTDASNPSAPLVFDSGSADGKNTYTNVANGLGSVWGGLKAVVIRVDNSGAVETLVTTAPAAAYVKGTDNTGAPQNALDGSKKCNGLAVPNVAVACLP